MGLLFLFLSLFYNLTLNAHIFLPTSKDTLPLYDYLPPSLTIFFSDFLSPSVNCYKKNLKIFKIVIL